MYVYVYMKVKQLQNMSLHEAWMGVPLHGNPMTVSCYTSRSANRGGASPCRGTTPSPLKNKGELNVIKACKHGRAQSADDRLRRIKDSPCDLRCTSRLQTGNCFSVATRTTEETRRWVETVAIWRGEAWADTTRQHARNFALRAQTDTNRSTTARWWKTTEELPVPGATQLTLMVYSSRIIPVYCILKQIINLDLNKWRDKLSNSSKLFMTPTQPTASEEQKIYRPCNSKPVLVSNLSITRTKLTKHCRFVEIIISVPFEYQLLVASIGASSLPIYSLRWECVCMTNGEYIAYF